MTAPANPSPTPPDAGASALVSLSHDLAGAVERAGRSVVAVHARPRIPSSGVYWRPGVIVTTDHTTRRDDEITVTLGDGRTVPARLAGRDPTTDLAVLAVDAAADPAASSLVAATADAAALRVGHVVLAVGRPGDDVTASLGVVSAVGAAWRTWRGGEIDRFVRLDLAIYDGFSGGATVDAHGAVLGVNTSGLARGQAVCVPAATVNRVADQLLSAGRVPRGYLGVAMQPVRLPAALARSLGLAADTGVIVLGVEQGGPADAAGLLVGDVLVSLEGRAVREPAEVAAHLGPDRVGTAVRAQLVRGGQLVDVPVTVGERPRRGR